MSMQEVEPYKRDRHEGWTAHSESVRMRVAYGDPESGIGYIDPYEGAIITPGRIIPVAEKVNTNHSVSKTQR